MTPRLALARPDPLLALVLRIRSAHEAVQAHARGMVAEAIAAGEALIESKALVRHGGWYRWLAEVGVKPRTAQEYMHLAREAKCAGSAHLDADSISGALLAIRGKRRKEKPPPTDLDAACANALQAFADRERHGVNATPPVLGASSSASPGAYWWLGIVGDAPRLRFVPDDHDTALRLLRDILRKFPDLARVIVEEMALAEDDGTGQDGER